jgi:hypothetical protein
MSNDPNIQQPKSSSTNVLLIIFGVLLLMCVGGGVLVIVCITAIATIGSNANGTFTLVATKVSSAGGSPTFAPVGGNPAAEIVARQFLDDIGAGRLPQARERMTAAGKIVSQGSMQAELDKNPTLKQHKSFSLMVDRTTGTSVTYTATVFGKDGSIVRVTLEVINEDGRWLVDQFNIKK